jgi:hypothetical protein
MQFLQRCNQSQQQLSSIILDRTFFEHRNNERALQYLVELALSSTQIFTCFSVQITNAIISTLPLEISTKTFGIAISIAEMQRCVSLKIAQVHICSISQRQFHKSFISVLARNQKYCVSIIVPHVNRNPA